MAFKFKTKKRPNALQSALAGFAGGFGTGFNKGSEAALTQMLKEREEKKNAVNKELNIFNQLISGLPSTPNNRSDILNARLSIMKGGVTATEVMDTLNIDGLDFQTGAEVQKEIKDNIEFNKFVRDTQSESLDPRIATQEASAMEQAGMIGKKPTALEVKQRTEESEERLGLTEPKKRQTYLDANKIRRYVDTGDQVFADDTPKPPKPKFTEKDKMELLKDKIEDLRARLNSKANPSMRPKVQAEYDKSIQQYNAMVNEALGFEDEKNPLGL